MDISDNKTVPMDEEDLVMVIEVDEDDENWMDSPVEVAPVPPPAPAPPAVLVAPAAPTPLASPVAPAAPIVPTVVSPDGPEEEDPG